MLVHLVKIHAPDFDLATTLDSGQVFHWEKIGNGFVGAVGDSPVCVEQRRNVLKVRCGRTPQPTRQRRALPRNRWLRAFHVGSAFAAFWQIGIEKTEHVRSFDRADAFLLL